MTGRLRRQEQITRADLRANPGTYYVFGDNLAQSGLGGQAREMRGEPNAIGVPTKRRSDMRPDSFLNDADLDDVGYTALVSNAFRLIRGALALGFDVVIPAAGLGTGLAQLPRRAPRIHAYIKAHIEHIEEDYP